MSELTELQQRKLDPEYQEYQEAYNNMSPIDQARFQQLANGIKSAREFNDYLADISARKAAGTYWKNNENK